MLVERFSRAAIVVAAGSLAMLAAGPTFVPDSTFKGYNLNGWQMLGDAQWKAQNSEVIATPKAGGRGGWLMLDRSFQDVGLYARVKCAAGCKAGVLLRAEKTASGFKGVYVALTEPDLAAYSVK